MKINYYKLDNIVEDEFFNNPNYSSEIIIIDPETIINIENNIRQKMDESNLYSLFPAEYFDKVRKDEFIKQINYIKVYTDKDTNGEPDWASVIRDLGIETNRLFNLRNVNRAIIFIGIEDNHYAINYGASSHLLNNFYNKEFPFEFAKRIDIKNIKRTASNSVFNNKTNSINTYKNLKSFAVQENKQYNIKNLSFEPNNYDLVSSIEIGNSICLSTLSRKYKYTLTENEIEIEKDYSEIEKLIVQLFYIHNTVENINFRELHTFPMQLIEKDEQKIDEIKQIIYNILYENIFHYEDDNYEDRLFFTLPQVIYTDANIYFSDDTKIIIKYDRTHENIIYNHDNIPYEIYKYLKDLCIIKNINNIGEFIILLNQLKIKIEYSNDKIQKLNNLLNLISYNQDKDVFYEGLLYYFNQDLMDSINNDVIKYNNRVEYGELEDKINIEEKRFIFKDSPLEFINENYDFLFRFAKIILSSYNEEIDFNQEWDRETIINYFLNENSFLNNHLINDRKKLYSEFLLNCYICAKNNWELYDRVLTNGKIEVADMFNEDTIYAVKISSGNISYIFDQINLSVSYLKSGNVEQRFYNIKNQFKKVVAWIFLDNRQQIINLTNLKSLMFKSKFIEWIKFIEENDCVPILKIDYIVKN